MKNKTKILFAIFITMIISQYTYSFELQIISPRLCTNFFSSLIHPDFIYDVKFIAHRRSSSDSSRILYKIFVEQNGHVLQMDQERTGDADAEITTPINLQNFTNLSHNEKLAIRIEVRNINGNGAVNISRGYLVVYKNGRGRIYDGLTNGSSQLTISNFCTFYCSGDARFQVQIIT